MTTPRTMPANRVGPRTLNAIRYELVTSRRPLTISELGMRLGKSYHTIKAGLDEVGAELVEGSYPKQWTLGAEQADLKMIGKSDEVVLVPYRHHDKPAERWNKARKAFTSKLAEVEFTPDADIDALSKLINEAASTLASIGYLVEAAKGGPDWFEKLGGTR